jgi:exocyst complex protein 7
MVLDHAKISSNFIFGQVEPVISTGPSIGISAYLETVDKIRGARDFFTTKIHCKAGDDVLRRVNELLPKAAVELENEFSRLLSKCRLGYTFCFDACLSRVYKQSDGKLFLLFPTFGYSKPVELELLFNFVPSHSSAEDPLNPFALPTLVDSRYIPLLSKLVQKSVELGRHNQVLKVYRCSLLEVLNCLTYSICY